MTALMKSLNPYFRECNSSITQYEMVYNRWVTCFFIQTRSRWNGMLNQAALPIETYIYTVSNTKQEQRYTDLKAT